MKAPIVRMLDIYEKTTVINSNNFFEAVTLLPLLKYILCLGICGRFILASVSSVITVHPENSGIQFVAVGVSQGVAKKSHVL